MSFHALVADLDYPMFVVTAAADLGRAGTDPGQEGAVERAGCLAGFVTQASIDPPRLVVLLSKANRTWAVARSTDTLLVHFLHEGNHGLAALFGGETGDEVDKFDGCDWYEGPGGAPVLRGTRGWVEGGVLGRFDAGDHEAHLLEVRAAHVDVPARPLCYQSVRDIDPGHPA